MSRYSAKEEKANTYTHAVGIVFGLIAGSLLIQKSISSHDNWAIVSYSVYALFMTLSYLTSTLYHIDKIEIRKTVRRKFDHAAIYCHIAGTYTPFTLVVLRNQGGWGWSLFAIIWLAAAAVQMIPNKDQPHALWLRKTTSVKGVYVPAI